MIEYKRPSQGCLINYCVFSCLKEYCRNGFANHQPKKQGRVAPQQSFIEPGVKGVIGISDFGEQAGAESNHVESVTPFLTGAGGFQSERSKSRPWLYPSVKQ
jgi:hypothetical protein